jgi:hypothetical protein
MHISTCATISLFAVNSVYALTIDLTSTGKYCLSFRICRKLIVTPDSIKTAAQAVAKGVVAPYIGTQPGQIPGIYPSPYYWWSGGAIFDALVDYWYLTGDSTYNDIVKQSLEFQVGPNSDYMPPNQTKTEVHTHISHSQQFLLMLS